MNFFFLSGGRQFLCAHVVGIDGFSNGTIFKCTDFQLTLFKGSDGVGEFHVLLLA